MDEYNFMHKEVVKLFQDKELEEVNDEILVTIDYLQALLLYRETREKIEKRKAQKND